MMSRKIDHIVYCVKDLNKEIDHIEKLTGVRPKIGGIHQNNGTKNALLNLGNSCYLEILAIDKNNKEFEGARWMGIDLIDKPKITRWSLKSENLERDSEILSEQYPELGIINEGSRQTTNGQLLLWKMILPLATPEIEILPFMTDWSQSDVHPSDSLQAGCMLQNIEFYHPNPSLLKPILSNLGVDIIIKKSEKSRIVISVESPNGIVHLD